MSLGGVLGSAVFREGQGRGSPGEKTEETGQVKFSGGTPGSRTLP